MTGIRDSSQESSVRSSFWGDDAGLHICVERNADSQRPIKEVEPSEEVQPRGSAPIQGSEAASPRAEPRREFFVPCQTDRIIAVFTQSRAGHTLLSRAAAEAVP